MYSVAPNVVSYNIAISACAKGRKFELALELLEELKSSAELEPDATSYNALLHALDNCKEAELALDHLRKVTAAEVRALAFAGRRLLGRPRSTLHHTNPSFPATDGGERCAPGRDLVQLLH